MEKKLERSDHGECCKTRSVLWYLVFSGFAVNYMLRINLNMAIVSMVSKKPSNTTIVVSECITVSNSTLGRSSFYGNEREDKWHQTGGVEKFTPTNEQPFAVTVTPNNSTSVSNLTTPANLPLVSAIPMLVNGGSPTFPWDEHLQGSILGAFFWLHWVTQVPGGLLASRYGTKVVFGFANFVGVLFCFVIPSAAKLGAGYLIAARLLQGLVAGFAWPSMHHMAARWIPPNERSKFVTAYLGSSMGAAMTYPMCGLVTERWGWEMAFYVCGILGTLWFIFWWILIYDSPAQHPRISSIEREYIEASIGNAVTKTKVGPIPWCKIFTSVPVMMNVLAQWGGVWGLFTLMTYSPTYFKLIHGTNVRATGILSGIPHLVRFVMAVICSFAGDYLLRSNKMSRTNVRKLATAICLMGQGIFMLSLAYSGCNYTAAVILLTLAVGSHGTVSTGPLACLVDIAPNYASISLGFANTIVAGIGFVMPSVVGALTFENQTVAQWQKVYWVATAQLLLTGILYSVFSTSEIQDWNFQSERSAEAGKELLTVKEYDEKKEKNNLS